VTRDQLVIEVRRLLADRLAVKLETIALDSRLIDDLGADSLDFIDLVFNLEKKFGVKIPEDEFDFLARLDFTSPEVMREGFLTVETVEKLRPRLPGLGEVPDPGRVTPKDLFGLLTVASLCELVESRLSGFRNP
jgi:acyl carrier protein